MSMQRRQFFRVIGAGVTAALVPLRASQRAVVVAGHALRPGTFVFWDDGHTIRGVWDGARIVTSGRATVAFAQTLAGARSLSRTP